MFNNKFNNFVDNLQQSTDHSRLLSSYAGLTKLPAATDNVFLSLKSVMAAKIAPTVPTRTPAVCIFSI